MITLLEDYLDYIQEDEQFMQEQIPYLSNLTPDQIETIKQGAKIVGTTLGINITSTILANSVIILTPTLWAAWRLLSSAFSKRRRKCGIFKLGSQREKCLDAEKIRELRQRIRILTASIPNCKKAKDPKKCVNKGKIALTGFKQKLQSKETQFKEKWNQPLPS